MPGRYDDVMSLSVRKGFIWPTADIYGGFGGFYDYGHLGAGLKRKWEDAWLRHFVKSEDNYYLV
ncbi:MAG: glycine--tRNA ligase, partial [Thermoplasmata archaeon]|nr:glycine--tRNA ligase [Thermoplasmata archaeon]